MRVLSLASGSKGNCYFVESGEDKILVDCGLSLKMTEERLMTAGVDPSTIRYVIITHEHTDHTKGLANFFKKYKPQIFCNYISAEKIEASNADLKGQIKTFDNEKLFLGQFVIDPIPVSHDSYFCTAYRINHKDVSVSIVTDLGYIDTTIINAIAGSKVIYLESNHDEKMLKMCHYPAITKNRIAGNTGHLSNAQAGQAITDLVGRGTKHFVLSHISENSNTYEKAYITIANILVEYGIDIEKDIVVRFAHQHKIGNNFRIGEDE